MILKIKNQGILILLLNLIFLPLSAQGLLSTGKEEYKSQKDTIVKQVKPFPSTEITFAATETFNLLSESIKKRLSSEEIFDYNEQIDTLFTQVDAFLNDSSLISYQEFSARDLDNNMNTVQIYIDQVSDLQNTLSERSKVLETVVEDLTSIRKRWRLTLEQATQNDIPIALLSRIESNMNSIDSVRTLIMKDIEVMLIQLDRLTGEQKKLESFKDIISEYMRLYSQSIFKKDMSGLFKDLSNLQQSTLITKRINNFNRIVRSDLVIFRMQFRNSMIAFGILFIFLWIYLIWFRKNYPRMISIRKYKLSDHHLTLINSPLLVALLITMLLIRFILPDLPDTFNSMNSVILIIPVLIITNRLYSNLAKPWVQWFTLIFLIIAIYEFIFYPDVIQRIILLMLSLTGFGVFLWMILKNAIVGQFKKSFVYNLLVAILVVFTIMLFIAVIGNITGAYRLAEFFTLTPTKVVITALAIHITCEVADTLLFLILANKSLQKINVFKDNFKIIHEKSSRLVTLILWMFFIVIFLNLFMIKEPVFSWGDKVLREGWKFGAVDISLGSILIFIFVIWLSLFVSRIVRAILEKDVFTRVTTAKGIPSTIIMLVRIGLITGGFLLAAAAAGMKLTNLSIIIGAFSVGIGFGLQNIFNNMVSGLILAFERPIKVGDIVQVGELTGNVLSIGFRSSTIKSFDGAEVIVPNGNLISNEMINWTLTDSLRRMDIRIGVAYGTDPEVVLDLIQSAAAEHELVRQEPQSKAYFIGFGDSSLDFRLLAWSEIDNRLTVESDLSVAINRKLKEAGIEIPFPQRDLHIRSDDTKG